MEQILRREWAEEACIQMVKEQREPVKLIREIGTENYQCLPPQFEEIAGVPNGWEVVSIYSPGKFQVKVKSRRAITRPPHTHDKGTDKR